MISNQWSLFTNGGTSCWDYLAHKPTAALKKKKQGKKHAKHIIYRYLWSVSMQAYTPPKKKETCLINIKQAQTKQLYDRTKIISQSTSRKCWRSRVAGPTSPSCASLLSNSEQSYFGRMGSPTKKTRVRLEKYQFNSSCNSLYIVYTCTYHKIIYNYNTTIDLKYPSVFSFT